MQGNGIIPKPGLITDKNDRQCYKKTLKCQVMYFCSTKVKYNKKEKIQTKTTEKGEKDFQQGEHFRRDFN